MEVARALGKIPDKRSIQPMYDLDKKLQATRDPDNITLKKLKEAVSGRSSSAIHEISTVDPSSYNFFNGRMRFLRIASTLFQNSSTGILFSFCNTLPRSRPLKPRQ